VRINVPSGLVAVINTIKKNGVSISLPTPSPIQLVNPKALLKDPIFEAATSLIKLAFPTFDRSLITKCERQIIVGTIYRVFFTLKGSVNINYEIQISVPLPGLGQVPTINFLKKNGVNCPIPGSI
jgi:hypothetical protein